jgi:hypothetical protein
MSRYMSGTASDTANMDYYRALAGDVVVTALLFYAAAKFAPSGMYARPLTAGVVIVGGRSLVKMWAPFPILG